MPGRKPQEPKKKSAKLLKLEAQEAAIQKEKTAEIKRLNKAERDKDTRLKILLGQAFLKRAHRKDSIRKYVYHMLDEDLKRQYDRDVFDDLMEEWGLPRLPPLAPPGGGAQTAAPTPVEENEEK